MHTSHTLSAIHPFLVPLSSGASGRSMYTLFDLYNQLQGSTWRGKPVKYVPRTVTHLSIHFSLCSWYQIIHTKRFNCHTVSSLEIPYQTSPVVGRRLSLLLFAQTATFSHKFALNECSCISSFC